MAGREDDEPRMRWLSMNCRDAKGEPGPHACTGCLACPCHAVPPPANFRELVEQSRQEAES
jgi:hypothetical protein